MSFLVASRGSHYCEDKTKKPIWISQAIVVSHIFDWSSLFMILYFNRHHWQKNLGRRSQWWSPWVIQSVSITSCQMGHLRNRKWNKLWRSRTKIRFTSRPTQQVKKFMRECMPPKMVNGPIRSGLMLWNTHSGSTRPFTAVANGNKPFNAVWLIQKVLSSQVHVPVDCKVWWHQYIGPRGWRR